MTDAPVSLRKRSAAWAATLAALAMACAVSVPPSGGPEDKTPPGVLSTVPAADSAGVATDAAIRITFSEDMRRSRVERLVAFAPEVVVGKADFDGRTLVIEPAGGLLRDTTYVVTLKSGFQDHHGVAAKDEFRFAFATSAHVDSGRVAGTVLFRREPTKNGVVNCYTLPADTGFAPAAARPHRQASTNEAGRYTLDYLPTDDRAVLVWAFEDKNDNRSFDPDTDVGLAEPDTVFLTRSAPSVEGVALAIVDPDEPAVVRGRVINASGIDSLGVAVALYAEADSLPQSFFAKCDTAGLYEFAGIRAGSYALRAFVDVRPDSVCGAYPCGPDSAETCDEPCATHPDRVVLEPGETRTMSPLDLPAADRKERAP